MNHRYVATELMRVAAEIAAVDSRLAMGILQEAKAAKLKAMAVEFFQEVKDFRGAVNDFVAGLTGAVRSPAALRAFPELKDVLELGVMLRKGVLRHTFLSEADLADKMLRVVEADAGTTAGTGERHAMRFPSQDALDKYLKEHPGADRSKHKVNESEDDIRRKIRETPDEVEERLKKQMGEKYKPQEQRIREEKEKWDKKMVKE